MAKYSIFSSVREAVRYHQGWPRLRRQPEPREAYGVVIGGGESAMSIQRPLDFSLQGASSRLGAGPEGAAGAHPSTGSGRR